MTSEFSNIIHRSNHKRILLVSDEGREFVNRVFTEFLNNNDIKRYSRYTNKGAVFAERFNRTICDLLTEPVCERAMQIGLMNYQKYFKNIIITYTLQK